ASVFMARALPLQVNVTHTPPTIRLDNDVLVAPPGPGYIGVLALQPSTFTTRSYGWKDGKRLALELVDSGSSEEKVKVQVMLT
ncbi:hypothetical protein B0F90DRAFT_1590350, partial [Multifurca ochricompacta]